MNGPQAMPTAGKRILSVTYKANAIWPQTVWPLIDVTWPASCAWLAGRRLQDMTVSELAGYSAWLDQQSLAPKSVTRHIASLKVFFRFLQLEGELQDNQADLLGSRKLWQRVPHVLSVEQVDRLLAAPRRADPLWLRDRALLELLYRDRLSRFGTGHLTHTRRPMREAYIVCHGKGDKQRIVPLGQRALAAVARYLEDVRPFLAAKRLAAKTSPATDLLLLSIRGRPLRRERIWELLKRYAARIGRRNKSAPIRCVTVSQPICWRVCRPAAGAGTARTCQYRHHANLHACRPFAFAAGPPEVPPQA